MKKAAIGPSAAALSRTLIVETALAQIDRSGPHGLSMRSLAQELGVEAMSLYRYVRGKEDLLEGVITRLMGGLASSLDEKLAEHWQGFLQTVAHEVRRIAIDHPRAFPLVARVCVGLPRKKRIRELEGLPREVALRVIGTADSQSSPGVVGLTGWKASQDDRRGHHVILRSVLG